MSTQTMPSPALYFDTIFAFQRTAALISAIELDVFTVIGDGAQTVNEIAKACGVPTRGIRILCDYLTTVGLVEKTGETYQLTADSAVFLTKRSPAYLGGTAAFLHSAELTGYFERLTETIRHGAQVSIVADDNPAWVEFARAMPPMMMPSAQAIADILGASAAPMRVLDLAAGHGIFGLVIAQHNPKAEIVAVDWAQVLEVATENAKAMGVGDRHRTLAGDAFKVDYGSGFDVALVTNFVHHFDRQTNVAFLKRVAGALKTGGRVVVLEFVPNEDRVTPPMAARFSLVMLATTPGGDAYTLRELKGMLAEAGFRDVTEHPLQGPQTVIVATK
jgi:2-polyprenyl-3-methyl-5-hydroxy-6-metoxy-1,4-benzoquinol methylase